jgi:multidrug resistance efflux pump
MSGKWLAAGVIVLVAAAAGVFFLARNKPQATVVQPTVAPPAPVPAPPPASLEITVTGQVQAANGVNVPAPVDGTIEELMAEVGDVVIEGKLLARIKNPKLASAEAAARSQVEQDRSRISELESALIAARLEVSRSQADETRTRLELERAEKEYQKQELMFLQGITPRLAYEKAQQDYNALKTNSEKLADGAKDARNRVSSLTTDLGNARRDLDQQKAALDQSRAESSAGDVRSPAEGIVVARCCQVGESVTSSSTTLFQIAGDLADLQVAAPTDSSTIARLQPGQTAVIEIPIVSPTITGRVREVKSGQVIIEFHSPAPAVRPGMTARVKIKLS